MEFAKKSAISDIYEGIQNNTIVIDLGSNAKNSRFIQLRRDEGKNM